MENIVYYGTSGSGRITAAALAAVTNVTNHDSRVYGANMGPTWVRQDPGGPHVGHVNLAIWVGYRKDSIKDKKLKL